ncbi:MAG: hypothetical protein M1829_002216 [Trizodia sp. TS-e1964]|nr:MAG: hypothetical protein M1829_002216 [Trizodia sp. TS-e1964]
MLLSLSASPLALLLTFLFSLISHSSAMQLIESKSLNPCSDNSSFTATLFHVVFTPENNSIAFDVVGVSAIQGNVTAEIQVYVYGYSAFKQLIDPCKQNLPGLCPMSTGQIKITTNFNVAPSVVAQVPSIAYNVPDLDGLVRIVINDTLSGSTVACVEAQISNQKTVDQKAVGWVTAVIAGLALLASAVTSGLGHSVTASHVAANALSLFGYFQAQSIIGMAAVPLPPIVQSWTQNFSWSMGIINITFMQSIFTWYQKATGGAPTTLLSDLSKTSIQVQKRSLESIDSFMSHLVPRAVPPAGPINQVVILRGINRVAFRALIESSNFFMTGLAFFVAFVFFVCLSVAAFKGFCEIAAKSNLIKGEKFLEFRNGWKIVLKGILFRLALIGFPQMVVLCIWEFTRADSPAEVVLALFFFASLTLTLAWAALKVIRIAKRSVTMHKSPAYILYSDPSALNKWGFLYVQFRATAYYFIVPLLFYVLLKGLFIAVGQNNGKVQAIALLLIEAGYLIGSCILRPWMDKKTNVFNISIAVVNFLNTLFLMIFTGIFSQPGIVTGVIGVVFFVINAVFALILLVLVIISSIYALVSKNPEGRYAPMRDDRASFIKSQTQLTNELDALGVTARGEIKAPYKSRDLDDDDSLSSSSLSHQQYNTPVVFTPPASANPHHPMTLRDPPHSPVDPSVPFIPHDGSARHAPPSYNDPPPPPPQHGLYHGYNESSRPGSDLPLLAPRSHTGSPSPYQAYGRSQSPANHNNIGGYRQQNNSSPWQRGAGYE